MKSIPWQFLKLSSKLGNCVYHLLEDLSLLENISCLGGMNMFDHMLMKISFGIAYGFPKVGQFLVAFMKICGYVGVSLNMMYGV